MRKEIRVDENFGIELPKVLDVSSGDIMVLECNSDDTFCVSKKVIQ